MGKEALATKYRPKRFADVVEQDVTKAILTEQLENKTFKNCLLFCGGAGTGKAQPLNSKVLTPKGFVKMRQVKIGMEVITGDYNTALISGVFPQGKREIYKIYLSNGDTIQVSDEHINIIYTENKEGKFEESTMLTKDLINIDYTNLFMRKIVGNGLFNAYYSISDIKFVGLKKCQCILVDAPEHTYITDNYIVTHNTTSARIFANEINKFKGEPIEIDAASNNSVDDARRIIESAKTQSLDSEYKVFVLDECVTGDTEILTDKGWKRIDSLTNLDSVAQYNNGNIEFIKDYEYINKYYEGDMYKVYFRNGKYSILMSPHHVQPVRMKQSGKIVERYITDCKFTQKNEIIVSGSGTGNNNELTAIDRLYIACQADGYYCNRTDEWELHLSIPRKKQRAIQLLNEFGIKYKISGSTDMDKKEPVSIRFRHKFPISKKLSDYFNVSMGVDRASDFISEILLWDGSVKSGYPGYYSCADKDNVDFVASILAQCNCSATQKCTHYDNPNHKDIYSVSWYYKNLRTSQAVSKECIHDWKGNIYCVKVPSHMIIVRAEGFTVVTGNCHMLSNAAWNAMLKLVEEPPKKSVFLFCTTDPHKIPDTILSRVQRYNFQKISQQGIVNRLKYIIEQENKEDSTNLITYEESALEHIAKVADGGMRDSITLLDKSIGYNNNLTLNNVLEALGSVNYDTMFELTDALNIMDKKKVVEVVESIHRSGLDLKQFIKQYTLFILDVCKYDLFREFTYLQLPNIYKEKLDSYDDNAYIFFNQLLGEVSTLSNNLRYESMPKPVVEATFLQLCTEA